VTAATAGCCWTPGSVSVRTGGAAPTRGAAATPAQMGRYHEWQGNWRAAAPLTARAPRRTQAPAALARLAWSVRLRRSDEVGARALNLDWHLPEALHVSACGELSGAPTRHLVLGRAAGPRDAPVAGAAGLTTRRWRPMIWRRPLRLRRHWPRPLTCACWAAVGTPAAAAGSPGEQPCRSGIGGAAAGRRSALRRPSAPPLSATAQLAAAGCCTGWATTRRRGASWPTSPVRAGHATGHAPLRHGLRIGEAPDEDISWPRVRRRRGSHPRAPARGAHNDEDCWPTTSSLVPGQPTMGDCLRPLGSGCEGVGGGGQSQSRLCAWQVHMIAMLAIAYPNRFGNEIIKISGETAATLVGLFACLTLWDARFLDGLPIKLLPICNHAESGDHSHCFYYHDHCQRGDTNLI